MSGSNTLVREFTIRNSNGMHIRPASLFVQTAMRFQSDIQVENLDTEASSDGKSVMGMLMLAAPVGTRLKVVVAGNDCQEAMLALEDLVNRGFDEE